ncbi:unnamed protein product [Dovyalis caffra]|uniref:Sulfite exporter TauE/SafE family protein n=1 Tax=Dovyalis caffra TaxID=77055 RepID=A0AAV1SI13_9ROSI|nr:unnamed protein product [Dovyalis caffra]
MKAHNILIRVTLALTILITFSQSNAEQTQPLSKILKIDLFLEQIDQWSHHQMQFQETKLKLAPSMVLTGAFCFMAAFISSAGGLGGGGLYIPILTIVAGLDLKSATSFTALMVSCGSFATVMCNLLIKNPNFGGKSLIDYDMTLLSEPSLLLGVSVGVICNLVFPEWLITILFAFFLAWSTFKTYKKGVSRWRLESEEAQERNECGNFESGSTSINGTEQVKIVKEPLMGNYTNGAMWIGILGCLISPNSSSNNFHSLDTIQRREQLTSNDKLTGMLAGLFGIGGGMFISPLLLHVGMAPEITAATCSFIVFFTSTMSAFEYLLLGMEQVDVAIIFAVICFVASLLGLLVVRKAIVEYGRASMIVFSVSTVMALSTVLMSSFGTLQLVSIYHATEQGTVGDGCEILTVGIDDSWRPLTMPRLENVDKKHKKISVVAAGEVVHCIKESKIGSKICREIVSLDLESESFTYAALP